MRIKCSEAVGSVLEISSIFVVY